MTPPNTYNNGFKANGSWNNSGPNTSEFEIPPTGFDAPPVGYTPRPQGVQSPVYGAAPQYAAGYAPQNGNKSMLIILVVLIALLIAGIGGALFAYKAGAFGGGKSAASSTVVTEYTQAPQAAAPNPVAPNPNRNHNPRPTIGVQRPSAPDYSSYYTHYRVGSGNTSEAFAANVFYEFVASYNASPGRYHSLRVYSPVTGGYYDMTCVGGDRVVCTGGDNARVVIW